MKVAIPLLMLNLLVLLPATVALVPDENAASARNDVNTIDESFSMAVPSKPSCVPYYAHAQGAPRPNAPTISAASPS
jgi:hypothetical protein